MALTSLRDSHMRQNQNYRDALIFNNNCLPLSHRPHSLIDTTFFSEPHAKTISVRELLINNSLITRDNLAILCGTMLTNDQYKKLKKGVTSWISKLKTTMHNKLQRNSKPSLINLRRGRISSKIV